MPGTAVFAPGGYRYIPAVFQYSAGVAAEDGFELERVRFIAPVLLAEAFAKVEAHLKAIGRPSTAFAHCELRSPAQFNDQGFIDFNKHYVHTLERWGIYKDGVNPVARTNVCPMYDEPSTPSMFAFTYTVPVAKPGRRTFMLSGGGDARAGQNCITSASCASATPRPKACAKKWLSSSRKWNAASTFWDLAGPMPSRRRPTRCRISATSSARKWRGAAR